ncbi:leucyl/phenylalanyl-tRNA--protein transferase [Neokomagataea thailandica NBRC 106555]|uniref:Leucyl/phenylalanyl-tRNA--protein transferase n=2 Tax=Neokomagataea TaxID=1223423 RepID=A0A4Y6V2T0_9PROT|nr:MULTISPECIES: leucyl/phenylalanyl-tRNA--protein transferase [Neokomagataea]QDH24339.1 leucyl/phenylalanyl-tRNA--protein transferase [Neokomagataea tanensis]GBR53199.1 leucyl/phenylalanyl-tRNA--protein transferase [Neokomagataea thailandica NBRC 106555]
MTGTVLEQLTPELLMQAYAAGVFPMAPDRESDDVAWYSPEERGIIPLDGMAVPRRLMRTIRSGAYTVTSDKDFRAVIRACAEPAPGREETWISERLQHLYEALFALGHAHSVEVWSGTALVGGLYGVSLGGVFCGESMFSRMRDVSKVALVHLVAGLRKGGFRLLDTQYTTPHLLSLGGVGISGEQYHTLLAEALPVRASWPDDFGFSALCGEINALHPSKGVQA